MPLKLFGLKRKAEKAAEPLVEFQELPEAKPWEAQVPEPRAGAGPAKKPKKAAKKPARKAPAKAAKKAAKKKR